MDILVSVLIILVCAGILFSAAVSQQDKQKRFVALVALSIRGVAAITVNFSLSLSHTGRLFPDETDYLSEARAVAGGGPFTAHAYSNLLGLMFKASHESTWLPVTINVFAGALLSLFVYEIARLLGGKLSAVVSGIAVGAWPSLVLWSSLVLKDTLTLLAVSGVILGGLLCFSGKPVGIIVGSVSGVGAALLRPYAYAALCAAMVFSFLVALALRRIHFQHSAALIVLLGATGLVLGQGFLGASFIDRHATRERVAHARTEGAEGGTRFGSKTDPKDKLLGQVPKGFLYAMAGPFPWQTEKTQAKVLLAFELPLWYSAMFLACLALTRLVRSLKWLKWLPWLLPLTFTVESLAIWAVYEANAGTVLRQRAMIIPVVVTLAAGVVGPRASARWPGLKAEAEEGFPA